MANEPYFIINGDNKAIASSYNYLDEGLVLHKSKANQMVGRTFTDYDGNLSIKSDYNRLDYEYFRANTSNITPEKAIQLAQKAYEKVGIIRNIIDTMSDLAVQGVRVQHPVRKTERFLEAWFSYVNGPSISERFLNMFYRICNVPVKTAFGTIETKYIEDWSSSKAGIDDTTIDSMKVRKRTIPLKYTFLPPSSLEVVGGASSLFMKKPYYVLKVSDSLRAEIAKMNSIGIPSVKQELDKVMLQIRNTISQGGKFIPLDQDKIDVYFYKKDDWQVWALPYIAACFDDLVLFERMKLADMSALDGAISNIRHWIVGIIDPSNPNNNILPTRTAINKMKNMLAMNVGGGTMDLVTGPEVKFSESNTQVHQFLGKEKYVVTLDNIYDCMGVPPPLRSGSAASTNSTNNYVSLKTLVERLQYGRNMLVSFWNKQLKLVQEAMGHKYPGQITFDQIILSDESAEKKLLIDLVDRNIISDKAVLEHFGYIPEIERIRINREDKARSEDKISKKASPFYNPQVEEELKKIMMQNGDVTPSELGIELEERKNGEKPRFEEQQKTEIKVAKFKPKGVNNGRPKNITETRKRKKKPNARPRTAKGYIEDVLWAEKTYDRISDIVFPAMLAVLEKSNARQLNNEESQLVEDTKFSVLCAINIGNTISNDDIVKLLNTKLTVSNDIVQLFNDAKSDYVSTYGRQPSLEEMRKMQILAYLEANYQ